MFKQHPSISSLPISHLLLTAVGLNTDAEESGGLSLEDPQEEPVSLTDCVYVGLFIYVHLNIINNMITIDCIQHIF